MHSGLVSLNIRDLDLVLLHVVKVWGSSGWLGTGCNKSNMENGWPLHIVLPDSALGSFTTTESTQKLKVSKHNRVHLRPVCSALFQVYAGILLTKESLYKRNIEQFGPTTLRGEEWQMLKSGTRPSTQFCISSSVSLGLDYSRVSNRRRALLRN